MPDFPHIFDPSRYSDYYLLSHLPEEKVQADVLGALHAGSRPGELMWAGKTFEEEPGGHSGGPE